MASPKWIYFLVSLTVVLERVQAATQLRLVNGLLIIEDRHPLEVSSSSGSISRSSSTGSLGIGRGNSRSSDIIINSNQNSSSVTASERSALRERNNDLHGHGYLNRNRASSLRHQRRLLKDAQARTTTTTTVRTTFIEDIIPASNNSIDDATASAVLFETAIKVNAENPLQPKTIIIVDTPKVTDKVPDSTDTPTKDKKPTTHTTAVNSVTAPTMDVITIVWYFSTFVALVAFFVVMVCSDKYCTRQHTKPEETVVTAPATPAPSYREFAPPSYDSVMRKNKSRVFIIPMLNESGELKVPDEVASPATATTMEVEALQPHSVQVEVQKPVPPQVTSAEENSQCKDTSEQKPMDVSHNESSIGGGVDDQLVDVVVLNENNGIKSAPGDANASRR